MKNKMLLKWFFLVSVIAGLALAGCEEETKKEGCGNGLLDLGEQCDGAAGEDSTCAELGYYNALGEPQCRADCTWDFSACGGRCGDSIVEAEHGEQCDGDNLNGNTCQSLGFSGGVLSCSEFCQYDLSGCVTACGNGYTEGQESCDDGNQAPGDGCSAVCAVETGWSCTGTPSVCTAACGDALIVGDEDCDGANLNGNTCQSLGFSGGTLACTVGCAFDTSACVQ